MENDEVKISIAVVTYNASKTLEETLNSIIEQDYNNKEIVIIDGKSTDDTLDIINKYVSYNLISKSEKDSGVYDAMNKCLKLATGDYIIFLGADDKFVSSSVLSEFVKNISGKNHNKIYYGNVVKLSGNYKYDGVFNKSKLGIKNICHQSIFYPKCVYKKDNYELKYKMLADYVYNIKHFQLMEYIELDIAYYNDVTGLSSRKKDEQYIKEQYILILKYLGVKTLVRTIIFKIRFRLHLKDKYMDRLQ